MQLLDFFEDANNFHIVYEYLELTYLDYITSNQNLKERQIKAVMFQVFKAI